MKTVHAVRFVGVRKSPTFSVYISPPRTIARSRYASSKAPEKKSTGEKVTSRREVATMNLRPRVSTKQKAFIPIVL